MTSPRGKAPENYGLFTTLISSIISFISRPCALSHHSQIIRTASFPGALHLRAGFEVRARVRCPRSTQSAPAERLRKAAHRTHFRAPTCSRIARIAWRGSAGRKAERTRVHCPSARTRNHFSAATSCCEYPEGCSGSKTTPGTWPSLQTCPYQVVEVAHHRRCNARRGSCSCGLR